MNEEIYKLKLGEVINISADEDIDSGCYCRRVPDGWIFTEYYKNEQSDGTVNINISSVFVPFHREFLNKEKKTYTGGSKII